MFGRTSGHPPFDWHSKRPKIDGCDVMGRDGTTICGSEHARHRSIRIIIDSDVGYCAIRYSQGIRKRANFRRRDQVMPCLSVLLLLLLLMCLRSLWLKSTFRNIALPTRIVPLHAMREVFFFSLSLLLFLLSLFLLLALVIGKQRQTDRLVVDQVGGRWRGPVAAETMQARLGYAEFTTTRKGEAEKETLGEKIGFDMPS